MPALSFKARFAPLVETGEKRQTIRKPRADGRDPKPGNTLYLYVGMRTKGCRKLREVRCQSVERIVIEDRHTIVVSGRVLLAQDRKHLAEADGFADVAEMIGFFEKEHGLPFEGLMICW